MKKLFFAITVIAFFAACKGKGWSPAERTDFISSCSNGATADLGADKAKAYCTCMQQKLEVKYPNSQDATKAISAPGAMQTPEMQAMVQACLNGGGNMNGNTNTNPVGNPLGNGRTNGGGGWTADDEQKFMKTCVQNATNAGGDQQTSNAHCNCTLKKIEKKYTSYAEADQKMTKDEVTAMEQECNQEGNGNN